MVALVAARVYEGLWGRVNGNGGVPFQWVLPYVRAFILRPMGGTAYLSDEDIMRLHGIVRAAVLLECRHVIRAQVTIDYN